jgi:hypothetical protein
MAASGTTKKSTINQLLGAGGTATLASATITGDLTLSAGTANGVGYLNASKVLTAGSTLLFDGTNLGIAGTGQLRFATSGGAIGDNTIGTENSFSMMLRCGRGSTSNIEIALDKLVFGTAASERYRIDSTGIATWSNVGGVAGTAMTLNSTGLGLGGSPTAKLDIFAASGGTVFHGSNSSDGGRGLYMTVANSGVGVGTGMLSTDGGSYSLLLGINGSEKARIDTSGNVVVGTAAVATTATDGFLYVTGCAGTPTGTPTAKTGRVPIVVDTTNNKLYFYSGGSWVAAN